MRDNEFTRILDWPGYRVFRHEIDETAKTLRLWVRRKRGNRKLICSGCGRKFSDAHDYYQREVRDLPWRKYRTTVIIEPYRVYCPECGVRVEKVPQLPSKAPFSKRMRWGWHAKRIGTPGGQTVRTGRQHGARDRPAVSEAVECDAPQGWLRTDGCGRDLLRQADEVHHRGQQLGDRRAFVVRAGSQARNAR